MPQGRLRSPGESDVSDSGDERQQQSAGCLSTREERSESPALKKAKLLACFCIASSLSLSLSLSAMSSSLSVSALSLSFFSTSKHFMSQWFSFSSSGCRPDFQHSLWMTCASNSPSSMGPSPRTHVHPPPLIWRIGRKRRVERFATTTLVQNSPHPPPGGCDVGGVPPSLASSGAEKTYRQFSRRARQATRLWPVAGSVSQSCTRRSKPKSTSFNVACVASPESAAWSARSKH